MAEQTFVTAEEIARLKELEAKATPAPWVWAPGVSSDDEGLLAALQADSGQEVCHFGYREMYTNTPGTEPSPEDQALITAARNLLPSLLVEREEMQKRIKELEASLRYVREHTNDPAMWSYVVTALRGEGGKPDGE